MKELTLGERIIRWAHAEPKVDLLVAIGSQVRSEGEPDSADKNSDWDFQIATAEPQLFARTDWIAALGLRPLAYVFRRGRLGSVPKVSAVFAEGELDLVIMPTSGLRHLAESLRAAGPALNPMAVQAIADLAAVLRGGYQILKGAGEFAGLYEAVLRESPPPRLSDDVVCDLAEGFVCDYVSTHRKIARGEFVAAQRWLHHQLAETNFRLLHELRLRQERPTYPDARRLELLSEPFVPAVKVAALPARDSLAAATEGAAATLRSLMRELVGERWRWPDLQALTLDRK